MKKKRKAYVITFRNGSCAHIGPTEDPFITKGCPFAKKQEIFPKRRRKK